MRSSAVRKTVRAAPAPTLQPSPPAPLRSCIAMLRTPQKFATKPADFATGPHSPQDRRAPAGPPVRADPALGTRRLAPISHSAEPDSHRSCPRRAAILPPACTQCKIGADLRAAIANSASEAAYFAHGSHNFASILQPDPIVCNRPTSGPACAHRSCNQAPPDLQQVRIGGPASANWRADRLQTFRRPEVLCIGLAAGARRSCTVLCVLATSSHRTRCARTDLAFGSRRTCCRFALEARPGGPERKPRASPTRGRFGDRPAQAQASGKPRGPPAQVCVGGPQSCTDLAIGSPEFAQGPAQLAIGPRRGPLALPPACVAGRRSLRSAARDRKLGPPSGPASILHGSALRGPVASSASGPAGADLAIGRLRGRLCGRPAQFARGRPSGPPALPRARAGARRRKPGLARRHAESCAPRPAREQDRRVLRASRLQARRGRRKPLCKLGAKSVRPAQAGWPTGQILLPAHEGAPWAGADLAYAGSARQNRLGSAKPAGRTQTRLSYCKPGLADLHHFAKSCA
jgi:hypothetical protein